MKKLTAIILAVLMIAAMPLALASCSSDAEYTIGIAQWAPHDALDAATKGFKDALIAEFGEDKLEFLDQNAQGDAPTCTTIINDFTTKNVDLIFANATPALQTAASATTTIPILGTSVTEYGIALNKTLTDGVVGGNISGTSDLAPLDKQADMLAELFPVASYPTVALFYCSAEPNSLYQVDTIKPLLEAKGYTCNKISFTDTTDIQAQAAAAAANSVIYVPTDNTVANNTTAVLGAIGSTPLVAGEEGICKGCGVATLSIDYYELGKITGQMAAKILKGEAKISEMKIEYAAAQTKKYMASRATALNITIPSDYVAIAE
ncbi:MAG: ABC transporter substrate-binding protein [Clostridia bacterium]|nr:ABC transporter substrate-binding protein [Clostridia bacterium]